MSDDANKELEEAKALPYNERVTHAKWKVRNEAWTDVIQEVSTSDEGCKTWAGDKADLFVTGVNDTNSAAQATAVEALTATLGKAESKHDEIVSAHGEAICKGLATKCLSGRPNTVKRAKEAFLQFVELGGGDLVKSALVSFALSHKVSKVCLNAIEILTEALKTYGSNALDPKSLLKEMPKFYDAKDAKVRNAAKELTAEFCRWIPPQVIRELLLADVRDATKKDIETLISQNESNKAGLPQKALRNSQAPEDAGVSDGADKTEEEQKGQPKTLETFDLADPVQILSDLDDFWTGLKATKWSTRRDALLSLKEKASVPKIEPGDFAPVVKELKRVITLDSNVSCVNAAINCVEVLARGLRKSFRSSSKVLCSCLLEKFKEKSAAVTKSIHEALASCFKFCISLLDVQDDIVTYMKHKNPKNRLETLKLCTSVISVPQELCAAHCSKVHNTILKEAANATQDSSSNVRDSALLLVTQFARAAGSLDAIKEFISSIDASRMLKVEQALLGSSKDDRKEDRQDSASPKASTTITSHAIKDIEESKTTKTARRETTKTARRESVSKNYASRRIQEENVLDGFKDLVGDEIFDSLKSSVWKDRLLAVQGIKAKAKEVCTESERNLDIFVASLCQLPGWGDSNFQVLLNVFETFIDLVESKAKISKENIELIVSGCIEKISDAKLNAKICELMDKCTKVIGVDLLCMKVLKKANNHKNPKVLLESMGWLLKTLMSNSSRQIDPEAFIEAVKDNLSNSNPNIRLATTNVVATVIAFRGLENKAFLGEVKPALMANIESAIVDLRNKGITPISPVKSQKKKQRTKEVALDAGTSSSKSEEPSTQLPVDLLDRHGNSNWKVRRSALEELMQIAKTRIEVVKSNINSMIPALRLRLHDANKNLIVLTLEILQHFPKCFDKQWERYNRLIIMDVLKVLCDNKKTVREAGILTLHSWTDVIGLKSMLPHFLLFISEAKTNVDGKVSIVTFLNELIAESALQFESCLPDVLTIVADCLLGKALSSRESSSLLLKALADVFPVEKIKDSTKTMNKARSESIISCLGKFGLISTPVSSSERRPRTSLSSRPSQHRTSSRPASAGPRATPKSSSKTAPKPEPDSFTPNDNKAERARKAPKRSLTKPLVEDIQRPEHIRSLESALSQYATKNLCSYLFHSDFKKHCTAVEIISTLVGDAANFKGISDNLDLIFQWFSYRICEGNMQVLVKILDAISLLIVKLKERKYTLTDYEAGVLIPCLVEKCGHNIDRIRQQYKDLLVKIGQIYSSKAEIVMLLQGMNSKNHRTKVVCLEVLDILHGQNGSDFYTSKIMKEVAILVSERDILLKNKALLLMASVYNNIGNHLWKYLSSIPESVRTALDLKFKSLEPASSQQQGEEASTYAASTPTGLKRPVSASRQFRSPLFVQNRGNLATTPPPGLGGAKVSPAVKKVEDTASLWHRIMTRASSEDIPESIEGMKQLCHILLDYSKKSSDLDVTTMVSTADKLVWSLSEKVRVIFNKAVEDLNNSSTRTAEAGSSRGCKYVLNTLMHSFQISPMAASVSEPTLRKIMKNLLILLLNEAIPSLEEGGQLLKALNVLMLKILENGNRTSTFLSLLWLLGEGACNVDEKLCGKFSDLIIKCLIKQTKHLSASIESVNLEGILSGIHTFLCSLDSGKIRQRLSEDDKPLRMVKTILHELCKLKGKDIYKYLLNIPRYAEGGKKPQLIFFYIDLYCVSTLRSNKDEQQQQNVGASSASASASAGKVGGMSSNTTTPSKIDTRSLSDIKADLAQIFKKIGDKASSKQGLEELYRFQKECPHIDIETHLKKTSKEFQEYIRNGLQNVSSSSEQQQQVKKSPISEGKENSNIKAKTSMPSIEELRQRVERAKALLNSTNDTK